MSTEDSMFHPRPYILEAVCGRCGETFIPNDDTDLDHFERVDGTKCGGRARNLIGHFAPPNTVQHFDPAYVGKHRNEKI